LHGFGRAQFHVLVLVADHVGLGLDHFDLSVLDLVGGVLAFLQVPRSGVGLLLLAQLELEFLHAPVAVGVGFGHLDLHGEIARRVAVHLRQFAVEGLTQGDLSLVVLALGGFLLGVFFILLLGADFLAPLFLGLFLVLLLGDNLLAPFLLLLR